jgi:hypothetical protein
MAKIHLKMVEYAQFRFDHHFWSNLRLNWSKCFQTGRISSELAQTNQPWIEFWPNWTKFDQKRWSNLNCAYSTIFKCIRPFWRKSKLLCSFIHFEYLQSNSRSFLANALATFQNQSTNVTTKQCWKDQFNRSLDRIWRQSAQFYWPCIP